MTSFNEIHHVHCLGLGGIGVSALARFFVSRDVVVSGCDGGARPNISGAVFMGDHDPLHIAHGVDLVVYTPAIPYDHPELVRARDRGIRVVNYPEALGVIAKEFESIAVSGTHGKSTTTALLASMFIGADLDPTAIVGAKVPGFDENFHAGLGRHFIIEGCEYKRGMLKIHPKNAIITNIEADHLDYYHDLADIRSAFRAYALAIPSEGFLVYLADDPDMNTVIRGAVASAISFGFSEYANIRGVDLSEHDNGITFRVLKNGEPIGEIHSPLPGLYNAQNILAAVAMADAYKIPFAVIAREVSEFLGIGRRFELLKRLGHTDIISDYAHHPTALRAASDALSKRYAGKRTLVVFQPHQTDRTRKMHNEFREVFSTIPELIVSEIYQVKGREETDPFSVQTIVNEANDGRSQPTIAFARDLVHLSEMLAPMVGEYDAILFLGAGDIDKVARQMVGSAA